MIILYTTNRLVNQMIRKLTETKERQLSGRKKSSTILYTDDDSSLESCGKLACNDTIDPRVLH